MGCCTPVHILALFLRRYVLIRNDRPPGLGLHHTVHLADRQKGKSLDLGFNTKRRKETPSKDVGQTSS